MNTKIIQVYDTITGKMVDVSVSQEVYKEYKRAKWREEKNDSSFFEHEIQFSQLNGGNDGSFENFREFVVVGDPTADRAIMIANIEEMLKAIKQLDDEEKELINKLFFDNMTERECADYYGINQKNINKKKKRILSKLYKLINF
ncbi:MAG: hypothetical protein E7494_10350 [Ruminococcus albus]|jgi:RNA polymerase sigma factor (sigma-70 family)|nr:hypothetical protein [Ruminococcus albus]